MDRLLPDGGRLVVVGGGVATVRLLQQLHADAAPVDVVVVAEEPDGPYDRPPLSKDVLLAGDEPGPTPAGSVADLAGGLTDLTSHSGAASSVRLQWRAGERAVGLDPDRRTVVTTSGPLPFDCLVLATGASPIRLPGTGPQVTLRRWQDAVLLRRHLRPGRRVVVVGAGWIGAEVVTAARHRGADVVCLEAGDEPAAAALGAEVAGRVLRPLWAGVDLRTRCPAAAVVEGGVRLVDGGTLDADLVVTGVGARPELGWLEGSGLATRRGVLVDEHLRSSAPGVLAVGDVAERWSPRAGRHVSAEHWEEAGGAGAAAAAVLRHGGDGAPLPAHDPVPYVWSDQLGHRVQLVGQPDPAARVVWRTHDDDGSPTALWVDTDGVLLAVLTVDRPREAAAARRAVGASRAVERLRDPGIPLHRA